MGRTSQDSDERPISWIPKQIRDAVEKMDYVHLINTLHNQDYEYRALAVRQIRHRGYSAAIPNIIELLGDDSIEVRSQAAHTIAQLGGDNLIDQLIAIIHTTDNWRAYEAACWALARLKSIRCIPQLASQLGRDRLLDEAITNVFQKIGFDIVEAELINTLTGNNPWAANQAARLLENSQNPEVIAALAIWHDRKN